MLRSYAKYSLCSVILFAHSLCNTAHVHRKSLHNKHVLCACNTFTCHSDSHPPENIACECYKFMLLVSSVFHSPWNFQGTLSVCLLHRMLYNKQFTRYFQRTHFSLLSLGQYHPFILLFKALWLTNLVLHQVWIVSTFFPFFAYASVL